jgi:hypothetical protein
LWITLAVFTLIGVLTVTPAESATGDKQSSGPSTPPAATQAVNPATGPVTVSASWSNAIVDFVEKREKFVVALSTALIAVFTVALVVATGLLFNSAEKAAKIAERALTEVQRAFVHDKRLETHVIGKELLVLLQWENGGTTPANEARS